MTAAIIGGGLAGLTAAYELVKAGERPFLIEPGQIGGMIRSSQVEGCTLEAGPNVLVERPDIRELLAELSLSSDVCYPSVARYGQYVWYREKPEKVPAGLVELIRSPLMSLGSKLLLPFNVLLPGMLPGRANDLSVADFFAPVIGRHATKHLLDPVLKGIYGGDVEDLSARSIFPGVWGAAREGRSIVGYLRRRSGGGKPPVMVIKGGIQRLPDALWNSVSGHVQRIQERAERISPLPGRRFRVTLSGGQHLEVDGCVVSSAGRNVAPLAYHLKEGLMESLESTVFATLTVVHFSVPRAQPLIPGAFGVLFPAGMPLDLLGVMFNSIIFPHVAPPDRHVITVIVGGAQAGERERSDLEINRELPLLLERLLGVRGSKWLNTVRWPYAIPQLVRGHYKVVEALDSCERENPGIVFIGVDRGGIGVSDRIRVAREGVKRFRRVRVETVV